MKRLLTILFILQVVAFSSCKKRLAVKEDPSVSTPETLEDLQKLLDKGAEMNEQITPSGPEAAADNYFMTQNQYDNIVSSIPAALPYTWQFNPFFIDANGDEDWKKPYKAIYIANVCLDNLPGIARTTDNKTAWDNVNGSALFFRAYYFLQLAWEFSKAYDIATAEADRGIPLKLNSSLYDATVRSSVQASYNKILADTKEAARYLPSVSLNCERPSKGAVYGLLARTYLSMQQYDSAFKYADLSLQHNQQLINYNGDADIVAPANEASLPFQRFNRETIFYTEMNSYHYSILPDVSYVDTTLYASYAAADLRKTLFFTPSETYQKFKGSYTRIKDYFFSGIATDEMYLTRAECYARAGNAPAALDDLNTLMITRWKTGEFVPFTASTPEEALDIILIERRKELVFRGLRWMDIKRLNKEEQRQTVLKRFINNQWYELEPNSDKYALPIPAGIIVLTGIEQNEGYSE